MGRILKKAKLMLIKQQLKLRRLQNKEKKLKYSIKIGKRNLKKIKKREK